MMLKADINWVSMTDQAIIKKMGLFVKDQRIIKYKTQAEIAKIAGVNRDTISKIENGKSVTLQVFIQVLRALDLLYVLNHFEVTGTISPLEAVKLKEKKKKRVRPSIPKMNTNKRKSDW